MVYQIGGVGSSDSAVRSDEGWLQLRHGLRGGRSDAIVSIEALAATCKKAKSI